MVPECVARGKGAGAGEGVGFRTEVLEGKTEGDSHGNLTGQQVEEAPTYDIRTYDIRTSERGVREAGGGMCRGVWILSDSGHMWGWPSHTDLTALGRGQNTVPPPAPVCLPSMMVGMSWGRVEAQMTVVQPAAVAMRAAVSLVPIPPVPHWLSPEVSTCTTQSVPGWGGGRGREERRGGGEGS